MENEKKDYAEDLTKKNAELTEDALDQVAGGFGFSSMKNAVKKAVPTPQVATETPLTYAIINDPILTYQDIVGAVGGPEYTHANVIKDTIGPGSMPCGAVPGEAIPAGISVAGAINITTGEVK